MPLTEAANRIENRVNVLIASNGWTQPITVFEDARSPEVAHIRVHTGTGCIYTMAMENEHSTTDDQISAFIRFAISN